MENIVITQKGNIKLIDFGFSKQLIEKQRTYTRWGTKGYVAPEITQGIGHNVKSDIWSFGILFWHMISGVTPVKDDRLKNVFRLISDEIYAKDLLNKCLDIYPDNRPSIKTIMEHKFFDDIDWDLARKGDQNNYFHPLLDGPFDSHYFSCKCAAL